MDGQSLFWDDLAKDLEDPEFLRNYIVESIRISTIDQLVNTLDDARVDAGMSKADVARAINAQPAVVRRLFSSTHANPTLATFAEVAAALGLRITVERLPSAERKILTEPLRKGRPGNAKVLATSLEGMRSRSRPRDALVC